MTINGVEILSSQIIYAPLPTGQIAAIIFIILSFIFLSRILDENVTIINVTACAICMALGGACLIMATSSRKTPLNRPDQIAYIVEITDDSAWKEIASNYKIIEQVYENKNIFSIVGQYK